MSSRAGLCLSLLVVGALVLLVAVSSVSTGVVATTAGSNSSIAEGAGTPPPSTPMSATTPLAEAAAPTVEIRGYDFEPAGLEVSVGTTVTWVNEDGRPHTVTAEEGTFDSGAMHRGSIFSHTFTEAGSYRYVCDYHLNMSGVVRVTD